MGAVDETALEHISGRCLCGAVMFSAEVSKRNVDVCHCAMCRRWSGGPFIGLRHDGEVRFEGGENIGVYKSSEWGERGFCKICGSGLYWRLAESDHYSFSAGALDDQSGLTLTQQIFIDEKPDYYELANETPKLTGEEAVAAFLTNVPAGKATE